MAIIRQVQNLEELAHTACLSVPTLTFYLGFDKDSVLTLKMDLLCSMWRVKIFCSSLVIIVNDELDSAYTSDAALYNPYLDSDLEMNDRDSDDIADGRFSDSEADRDRLMISYTDHFDPTIARTSDDIREELEEDVEEDGMLPTSILPESQQGEEGDYFCEELESSMEVGHIVY